uniref:Syntaxin 6 n=1 Tax=Sphaeramia orbicularis TaxID=375764 RepID=A0A672ZUW5_9TELE
DTLNQPWFSCWEVQKAVNSAQSLHHRWSELLQEGGGLRNSLRSIDIVESNPKKFNLDASELSKRKAFITSTRQTVKDMKEQMSSPAAAAADRKNKQVTKASELSSAGRWRRSGSHLAARTDKYSRRDRQLQNANSQFIDEQQKQQQQLELVSGTIGVLKNMSERIGMELDEQAVMLDDFAVICPAHVTSHTGTTWCAIGVLLAILFVVILLFFIL